MKVTLDKARIEFEGSEVDTFLSILDAAECEFNTRIDKLFGDAASSADRERAGVLALFTRRLRDQIRSRG